jgi:hypothetical protein
MIVRLRPNVYAAELTSVLDQLEAVVDHLVTYRGPPVEESRFRAAVPGAGWLLNRSHRAKLDELLRCTRAERAQLAAAVANDRQFDTHVDARDFSLQYPGLPEHVRQRSRALFVAFYETLARRGHRLTRPDGTTVVLDRLKLERGFFEANPELLACPACMEEKLAPAGAGPARIDCDHFLPKSIYGPLAVHPQNLVFICMSCNGRLKRDRDPLAAAGSKVAQTRRRTEAGALRRSYLPYRRAAVSEMQVKFTPDRVTLTAATEPACERVANLDRLFGLASTWTGLLPIAAREMFTELETLPTASTVKAVLDDVAARGQGAPERLRPGLFLRSRYAEYLRDHQLGVLTAEWQQWSRERRKSDEVHRSAHRVPAHPAP